PVEQPDTQNWMDKFFKSNGFQVKVIKYNEVAENLSRDSPSGDSKNILFVADKPCELVKKKRKNQLEEEGELIKLFWWTPQIVMICKVENVNLESPKNIKIAFLK
ncbi:hypothetical protein MKX01_023168, partial [Papaver californicum]